MVASTEAQSIADMKRGIGGRLEDAFESAKERGEAAFITFVTAGYPRSEGGHCASCFCLVDGANSFVNLAQTLLPYFWPCKKVGHL